ncbi:MAG: WxcM-like domain-containing protein, partial [Candidatus Micrarchaeota archaeon]
EEYSKPLRVEQRKLCTLYFLKPRSQLVKPGRELLVTYDDRFPRVEGFTLRYVYVVKFLEKGNEAGNHYHEKKQEFMIPLTGEMRICLEDVETKQRETINISAKLPVAVYVKTKVAHKVVAKKEGDTILVLASTPSADEDEIKYDVIS